MISEKIELLGKGLYKNIPDQLTLKAIPTLSELDYVGSEDFDETMISKILPAAVEEKIDFNQILEIDYQWICRCLRLLNFGPYHTTNSIFCTSCGKTSYGEYQVDLRTIECKPLPEGFTNDIVIPKDSFLDFNGEIRLRLPTIRQMLECYKDKAFQTSDGRVNRELARICYMVYAAKGNVGMAPIEVKLMIESEFSAADYTMLKSYVTDLTNYGLRAGGSTVCPKCGHTEAAFIALVDDRFFRCTVDNLRKWRDDRNSGKDKDLSGSKKATVREHN